MPNCAVYIYEKTGKAPSVEFCEQCPNYNSCEGELDEFTLYRLIKDCPTLLEEGTTISGD